MICALVLASGMGDGEITRQGAAFEDFVEALDAAV